MSAAVATVRPPLTSGLEQQKADLDRFGYCYVEDGLLPDRLEAARCRLEEQAAAAPELGQVYEGPGAGETLAWCVGQDRAAGLTDSPNRTSHRRSF